MSRRMRMRPVKIARSPYDLRQWIVALECGHEIVLTCIRAPRWRLYDCKECQISWRANRVIGEGLARICLSSERPERGQWRASIPLSRLVQ
jgi:hypothetical protein